MNDSEGFVSQMLLVGEQVPQTPPPHSGRRAPTPTAPPHGTPGSRGGCFPTLF